MPVTRYGASTCTIYGNDYVCIGDRTKKRWCLHITDDAPTYQINAYHPPGVNGNIVVQNGRTAKRIQITAVYCGDLLQILSLYRTDSEQYAGVPVSIIDDNSVEWARCYLEGMTRERPVGCEDGAFFLAHLQFCCHDSV
jgi:hypothetical protein